MSSPWGAQPTKLPSMDFNFSQLPKRAIMAGAAVLAALVVLFSTAYTIDEGERGVILRLGRIVGEAGPGLHFKIPFINTVEKISVQIQKESFEKTEMADTRLQTYSRDQQPATIAMAINYHVTDPSEVYAQYG